MAICLLPRAVMAWKITGICPDGVLYIRLAESFQKGDANPTADEMQFNLYPVILAGLHRAGLPWETAGAWWGVVISSCTVLPLYGWVRRAFSELVALAACLLYAFHSDLMRWSPELIRDPTFWFLFTLVLYLSWRAATEVRWLLFAASGGAIALAGSIRFEGLLLLVPLALWCFWRGWACPENRRRLVLGGVVCVGVFLLWLTLASAIWFGGAAPWRLIRTQPLTLAQQWAQPGNLANGHDAPRRLDARVGEGGGSSPDATPHQGTAVGVAPLSLSRKVELFAAAMLKGFTVIFLLLWLSGVAGWRHVWARRDHQALVFTSLLLFAAIWVHLGCARMTCQRYFFPAVIMMSPFAALGLLRWAAGLAGMADRLARAAGATAGSAGRLAAMAGAATLLVIVALNLGLALGKDYGFRTTTVELGHWAHDQFGPSPSLFGPDGVTQVVCYYAEGRCQSFSATAADAMVVRRARWLRPDVILLQADRKTPDHGAALIRQVEDLGFCQVDRSRFAGGCRQVLVLRRRGAGDEMGQVSSPYGPAKR